MTNKLITAMAAASLMAVSSPSFAQFDFGKLKDAVNQIQGAVAKKAEPVAAGTSASETAAPQARSSQVPTATASSPTAGKNVAATNFVDAEKIDDSFEGKQVNIEAQVKRNGKITYVEFGNYTVDGCATPVKGSKPGTAIRLNGTVTEFSMGGIGQMAAPPSFTLQNCKLADSVAGPGASVPAAVLRQASGAATTDNPVIETWMKTCMPFTAPTDLEKQIGSGQVTFKGIKVMSAGSADGGSGSVMSLTLAMDAATFKAKYPEFSRKIKLPKSKTCPIGGDRTFGDQSMTGKKGATIQCNCFGEGD